MVFRPRELREGTTLDEIRRELNEAQRQIASSLFALSTPGKVSPLILDGPYAAQYGEVVRVAPPSGGLRVILPPRNLAQPVARVVVVQEAATGALTLEAVDTTVNGADTLSYLAGIGTVELQLTDSGWYGWSVSLVASLPLTGLASQAANTIVANATAASASPTAVAVSADSLLARVGGNLVSHPWSTVAGAGLTYSAGALAVGAGTGVTVGASDVAVTTPLTDGDKGDITVATNGTAWTIDAGAVALAKMESRAEARLLGRALGAGTGAPQELTGAQAADILETEGFTWTGTQNFSNRVRWSNAFTADLAANTDNLAIGAVNVVRLTCNGGSFNLTGMVPDADDHLLWLQNADGADTITLMHDATSTAANRFVLPGAANYALLPRSAVWARYDGTTDRWYIAPGSA